MFCVVGKFHSQAILGTASVPAGSGGFAAIQTAAASFNIELTPVSVHDADEIERGISRFATGPNGGLVIVGPSVGFHKLIQRLGVAAGMPFPIHPHMLRHACGFKLANDGHDTRSLQHWLGHKNISNTTIYTAMSPDRFKDFWR